MIRQLDSTSDCTNCEGQPDVLGAQTKPVAKNSLKRWLKKLLIVCIHELEYSGHEISEVGKPEK